MKLAKTAAPAAKAVLRQATALKPKREKASDGLLPSAAHLKASPNSDHNTGFAVDLTHDPVFGISGDDVFFELQKDPRVKYLIFKGRIWSKEKGNRPTQAVTRITSTSIFPSRRLWDTTHLTGSPG